MLESLAHVKPESQTDFKLISSVIFLYTVRKTADIIYSYHHCFVFCKTQLVTL